MTILVLDGDLLEEALRGADEEELVIAVDESAARLEELEKARDPRVLYLIGDTHVLPLPDCSIDSVLGSADDTELRRVLRR